MTVLRAGASCLADLIDVLPIDETTLMRAVIAMRDRGLIAAGYGAAGSDIGVAGSPPPSEDDLALLLDDLMDSRDQPVPFDYHEATSPRGSVSNLGTMAIA